MGEDLIPIIGINEENCTNCHQCIAVCPVKFCGSGDVVKFNNNLCVDGRCIESIKVMVESLKRVLVMPSMTARSLSKT